MMTTKRPLSIQSNPNAVRKTSLVKQQIIQKIKIGGPLTIHEYMRIVLTAPNSGFYMKQDVFGSKGHFVTSPEISQIFGELIGVWLINEWSRFNYVKPLRIVELGPGRGTLLKDISRVLVQFSQARENASLHLVEVSPFLMQLQEQNLCGSVSVIESNDYNLHQSLTKDGIPITWYQSLDQVPREAGGFTFYLAHEFLDALPIHKFQRNQAGEWREILVDYDESSSNNELRYVLSRHPTPASKVYIPQYEPGNHYEICPEAALLTEQVISRLNDNDGCFLMCDYGYSRDLLHRQQQAGHQPPTATINKDTFRAFREHTLWNPLKKPGSADLTADVDFDFIKNRVADKANVFGPVRQDEFLTKLGIELRLKKLLQSAQTEKQAQDLKTGVAMILDDMGERFKFMSIFPKNSSELFKNNPPAGFL